MNLRFHSVSEKERLFALTVPLVRTRELILLAVPPVKLQSLKLKDEDEEEAAKQFLVM